MERKELFLNNDLSMMLSREQAIHDRDNEWEQEQQRIREEAEPIIENPFGCIDAKAIMKRSVRYADTADFYQKLFTEGTDEEQQIEIISLEYVASMTILPSVILMAGYDLLEKEDYTRWTEILIALHYVPLQKAFCYCLKRHKDFYEVLKIIDVKRLDYSQTFLLSLLDYWFEWLTQACGHLISYEDERGNYDNYLKAQELKKEGKAIRSEWEKDLPTIIHEIIDCFSKLIEPRKILSWLTKKPLRDDALNNPYSASYNNCLYQIWEELSEVVHLIAIPDEDLNLNMVLLMANKAVKEYDETFGKEVYKKLSDCLLKENFSNMEKKTEIEERRQRRIAQLLLTITPDLDFTRYVNDIATRFQGWNLDYQQVYAEARREAYLICSLFRVFEVKAFESGSLFSLWKNVVDVYLREYRRCDNEYILRDDFSVPFRVAVEVATNLKDDNCRDYLHEVILENVLSIVSLMIVFSECEMSFSNKVAEWLLQRIDREWPSAKMLMGVRGQRTLENRIENVIKQLRNSG